MKASQDVILSMLHEAGEKGLTTKDIVDSTGMDFNAVAVRMSQFLGRGIVRKLPDKRAGGVENRAITVWALLGDAGDFRTNSGKILETLKEAGSSGMTCDELEDRLNLKNSSISAALSRFCKSKHIAPDGRRPGRSGKLMTVYVVNDGAPSSEPVPRANASERRQQVVEALQAAGSRGMTCEELETAISLPNAHSFMPKLAKAGIVVALRNKRPATNGKKVTVWALGKMPEVTAESRGQDFWEDIFKRVREYAQQKATDVSEVQFDQILGDFRVSLRDEVSTLMNRLGRARQGPLEVVSRRVLLDACRTLQVQPPKNGEAVDAEAAKRNKRKMVRAYHPDAIGATTDATRDMYEAVIAAYETIEQYNESLKRSAHAA